MDQQNDLGSVRIDVGDDLMDDGADDTLLQSCIRCWGSPDDPKIGRERAKRCRIGDGRDRGGVVRGNFAFNLRHARQRLVPARLQFAGDQPVGRVGGVVLSEGAIRSIVPARRRGFFVLWCRSFNTADVLVRR